MDKMISMKRTAAEKKKMAKEMESPATGGGEEYPWGLRLDWNDNVLKKLGMDEMPEMGAEMHMHCKMKVVGCSESATEKNKDRQLSLQITDMMVDDSFESGFNE